MTEFHLRQYTVLIMNALYDANYEETDGLLI